MDEKMTINEFVEIAKTADEKTLREISNPWPNTIEELQAVINALTEREHDYGTCVYAMSLAATAAFNYVAHKEGCTGFQASCADMDILRRSRNITGPFALIVGNDLLYPQYDIRGKVDRYIEEWQPWAKDEARKLLEAKDMAHPNVKAHWQKLATT